MVETLVSYATGGKAWRRPRSGLLIASTGILLGLVFLVASGNALFYWRRSDSTAGVGRRPYLSLGNKAPPDPLALPGWRDNLTWVTADPEVQLHHWLQRLSNKENGAEVDWSRNKTVLLLGDSVLRDWIWRLCDNHLDVDRKLVIFPERVKRELNEKTHSWECVIPQTGLRLINGFLFGMSNYSRYPPRPSFLSYEWPPGPWGIEDRIPTLVEQYTPYQPDMIVINSGPWDFKFMFKRDTYENNRAVDIEPKELYELGERLRECMRMLRAAFPKSKHVFLQLHSLDTYDVYPKWWWAKDIEGGHKYTVDFGEGKPNDTTIEKYLPHLFTRRRVGQLSSTYRLVATQESWDDLDYMKLGEFSDPKSFFRTEFDAIHPSDDSIAVMLDWMFEKLWRWEVHGV